MGKEFAVQLPLEGDTTDPHSESLLVLNQPLSQGANISQLTFILLLLKVFNAAFVFALWEIGRSNHDQVVGPLQSH